MDKDPQLRRVIFDVPKEHLAELMANLGDFAMERDIDVSFGDPDSRTTEPQLTVEQQAYNPELVTWIKDPESDEDVAVITCDNLRDFAIVRNGNPMSGSTLYTALRAGPWMERKARRPSWKEIATSDEDGQLVIRADQAKHLLAALRTPNMRFNNLGKGLTEFFGEFCEALYNVQTSE